MPGRKAIQTMSQYQQVTNRGYESAIAAVESGNLDDALSSLDQARDIEREAGDSRDADHAIAEVRRVMPVTVSSKQYEDDDNCLAAAARDYAYDHGLESWQVIAEWVGGDDGDREEIALTVSGGAS